jgi:hypothetical protein
MTTHKFAFSRSHKQLRNNLCQNEEYLAYLTGTYVGIPRDMRGVKIAKSWGDKGLPVTLMKAKDI